MEDEAGVLGRFLAHFHHHREKLQAGAAQEAAASLARVAPEQRYADAQGRPMAPGEGEQIEREAEFRQRHGVDEGMRQARDREMAIRRAKLPVEQEAMARQEHGIDEASRMARDRELATRRGFAVPQRGE